MPWGKRVTESFESNSTRPPHHWYIDEFTISRTVHSENGQISSCAFFLAFPLLRVFMATSHGKVHNPGSKSQPCTNTRHILPKLSSLGIGFQHESRGGEWWVRGGGEVDTRRRQQGIGNSIVLHFLSAVIFVSNTYILFLGVTKKGGIVFETRIVSIIIFVCKCV